MSVRHQTFGTPTCGVRGALAVVGSLAAPCHRSREAFEQLDQPIDEHPHAIARMPVRRVDDVERIAGRVPVVEDRDECRGRVPLAP